MPKLPLQTSACGCEGSAGFWMQSQQPLSLWSHSGRLWRSLESLWCHCQFHHGTGRNGRCAVCDHQDTFSFPHSEVHQHRIETVSFKGIMWWILCSAKPWTFPYILTWENTMTSSFKACLLSWSEKGYSLDFCKLTHKTHTGTATKYTTDSKSKKNYQGHWQWLKGHALSTYTPADFSI